MKEIKLILTLEVDYDLGGAAVDVMKANLKQMVDDAMNRGTVTGDSPATVESWTLRIDQAGAEEDEEPEEVLLTQKEFVAHLRDTAAVIDPENAFRDVCLERDRRGWRRTQIAQYGEERHCKLELEDEPAFRQGLNDHADSMVKDRQWVTFDNGATYFAVDDIKEALAEFDSRPENYVFEPKLKDKIGFWL